MTFCLEPKIFALAPRTGTTSAPGTRARLASAAGSNGVKLSFETVTKSAFTWSSIASTTEERSPCASTATKAISASPIIRAAAVLAVRPGFRRAFSRASLPAAPPTLAAGQPRTPASGFTSRADTSATPKKSTRQPSPSASSRVTMPRSLTNIP